jgi:hypothetical protein
MIMTAGTKAQEVINQAFVERLRAGLAHNLIAEIRHGQEAPRKWAEEEAEFDELVRIIKWADEDDNCDLDDLNESTPLYSLRYVIGLTTGETLERLLDPDPNHQRDWKKFWGHHAFGLYEEWLSAWYALGFIHSAAKVLREVEGQLEFL